MKNLPVLIRIQVKQLRMPSMEERENKCKRIKERILLLSKPRRRHRLVFFTLVITFLELIVNILNMSVIFKTSWEISL